MEKRYEFRGDLATTPLPEVLETINRYRVPGVLDCTREGWDRKIFIQNGEIIFATSTNLYDSLGDFLLRKEVISRAQYDESVIRLKATKKRQGVVLVEMGVLSPKDLFAQVLEQVKEIVWDTFNWDSGEVTFSIGRFKDDEIIKLNIPTRNAILRGAQAVKDPKRLMTRLGASWAIYEPSFETVDLTDLALDENEMKLLAAVNGKRSLLDLTREGPFAQAVNGRNLYAFGCLKLIRKKEERAIKVQWKTTGDKMESAE